MDIETTRFGRLSVEDERIITFPNGLLGFPDHTRFALIQTGEENYFFWLQSVDEPNLAFVVTDPSIVFKDYEVPIKDETQGIGDSTAFLGFFFSPTGYLRSFTMFLGELFKELIQARRTRRSGVQGLTPPRPRHGTRDVNDDLPRNPTLDPRAGQPAEAPGWGVRTALRSGLLRSSVQAAGDDPSPPRR